MKKGQKMSQEQKDKISKSLMGHTVGDKTREAVRRNMLGKPAWNKGMKIWWKPFGQFEKGHIPAHAGKKRPKCAGNKHWHWRGGITKRPFSSLEYKQWRKQVFERDNYTCQLCGIRGGNLEADHIKPWSLFPKLRYEVDNGRTLCGLCHRKTETYGYKKEVYGQST